MAQQRSRTGLYVFLAGTVVIVGGATAGYFLWGRRNPALPSGDNPRGALPGNVQPAPAQGAYAGSQPAPTAADVAKAMGGSPAQAARTLRAGMKGDDVIALQVLLSQCGFPVNPGGTFDAATKDAVLKFQSSAGLARDGVAGPRTLQALKEALRKRLIAQGAILLNDGSAAPSSTGVSDAERQAAYAAAVSRLNG